MEFSPLQVNSTNGREWQVTNRSAVLSRIYQLPVTAVLQAPEAAFPSLGCRFRHRPSHDWRCYGAWYFI